MKMFDFLSHSRKGAARANDKFVSERIEEVSREMPFLPRTMTEVLTAIDILISGMKGEYLLVGSVALRALGLIRRTPRNIDIELLPSSEPLLALLHESVKRQEEVIGSERSGFRIGQEGELIYRFMMGEVGVSVYVNDGHWTHPETLTLNCGIVIPTAKSLLEHKSRWTQGKHMNDFLDIARWMGDLFAPPPGYNPRTDKHRTDKHRSRRTTEPQAPSETEGKERGEEVETDGTNE